MRPSSYGYISRLVRDELTEAQAALVRAEATLAFEAVNRTEECLGARLRAKALQRIAEAEETLKGLSRGLDDLSRAKSLSNEAADAAFNALCNERVRMMGFNPQNESGRAYVRQLETVSLWLTENFNVPVQ